MRAALAWSLMLASGCPDEVGESCSDCTDPQEGLENAVCVCETGLNWTKCWGGEGPCNSWCQAQTGMGYNNYTLEPCASNQSSGSCTAWAPENKIVLSEGIYHVSEGWLADLVEDPAPLWTCDAGLILPITGGYEISGTSAGEFLYELGLRNGDIPESINSMPLETAQDTIDAFIDLYLKGETDFELDVLRSSSTSTLYYKFY